MPGPRRIAVYAHFDASGEVKRYVTHHLERLSSECERLIFVSTSNLSDSEAEKARAFANVVIQRRNEGFDFGSWKRGLAEIDLKEWDELVLTNSSVIGPARPLREVFARMEARECDFWGLTEGLAPLRHLQSYFLVFRRHALQSETFEAFWKSVLPYRDKGQIILSYEVGLTRFLFEHGLRPAAMFPYEEVMRAFYGPLSGLRGRLNQSYSLAAFLLEQGMPYVKVEALRGVAWHRRPLPLQRLAQRARFHLICRALERGGFDLSLLEFDPHQLPPSLDLR